MEHPALKGTVIKIKQQLKEKLFLLIVKINLENKFSTSKFSEIEAENKNFVPKMINLKRHYIKMYNAW